MAEPDSDPPALTAPLPVELPAAIAEPVSVARVDQTTVDRALSEELPAEAGATAARSVPITEDLPVPVIVRSRVPEVLVLTTRWHPVKERRQAEVELPAEGRSFTVKEGDHVGTLRVSEITLSGVVFDHEGVELQRRVGEPASVD
jgi:hypothetical protein